MNLLLRTSVPGACRMVFCLAALLLPLGSAPLSGESAPQAPAPSQGNRWIEWDRGGSVREMLWIEEAGVIEYVQYTEGRMLVHRHGLMPRERFRTLLQRLEESGILQSDAVTRGGPGSAAAESPGCWITIHGVDDTETRACDAAEDNPAGLSAFADETFALAVGLATTGKFGSYARLGRPAFQMPAGLHQPDQIPLAGDASASEVRTARFLQELQMKPGRFLYLGGPSETLEANRLPADENGKAWVQDEDHWRPLLTYRLDPP